MSLEKTVTIRLSNEKYLIYEMRAASVGKKISPYLRDVLEDMNFSSDVDHKTANLEKMLKEMSDKLEALAIKSDTLIDANKSVSNEDEIDNISFEMLLMLRAIAKPEQLKMAHARMREKRIPILNLEDY